MAQLVARRIPDPKVASSNLVSFTHAAHHHVLSARVAQLVEHWSNKPTVAGSIPVVSKARCLNFFVLLHAAQLSIAQLVERGTVM